MYRFLGLTPRFMQESDQKLAEPIVAMSRPEFLDSLKRWWMRGGKMRVAGENLINHVEVFVRHRDDIEAIPPPTVDMLTLKAGGLNPVAGEVFRATSHPQTYFTARNPEGPILAIAQAPLIATHFFKEETIEHRRGRDTVVVA